VTVQVRYSINKVYLTTPYHRTSDTVITNVRTTNRQSYWLSHLTMIRTYVWDVRILLSNLWVSGYHWDTRKNGTPRVITRDIY